MNRVIIDTDIGIDDAHAVSLALISPEIRLEGITTVFGNTEVDHCTRNALYLLNLAGKTDIPVRQGVNVPLLGKRGELPSKRVHGEKGLGNFEPPRFQMRSAK